MRTITLRLLLLLASTTTNLYGQIGCMDDSYHVDRSQPYCDPKQLHYVQCNCPCERYEHDLKRNRCVKCLHYSIPTDFNISR